jgi:hypothetical protein
MTIRQNSAKGSALQRVRSLSHLLDNAIPVPGTNYRIGLDPILGLLPAGSGDLLGIVLSAYIVVEGIRMGLPKESLTRMVLNLVTDTAIGAVPIAGDLFDFAWKANTRNVKLLEAHINDPQTQKAADRQFVILVLLALVLIVLVVLAIAIGLTVLLWNLLSLVMGK